MESKAEQEAERIIEFYYLNPVLKSEEAVQCAIIHVEGIIKSNPTYDDPECEYDIYKQVICNKPFWQEVLTILKNK